MNAIAPKNVVNLYSFTNISILAGFSDYTEGIYNGNPSTPYEVAQKNQHNYLLNEIGDGQGFKLLDVGCGLGTFLETAKERGVIGTGITISDDQVSMCQKKGLDVWLFNYRHLLPGWHGRFDGIIANGSIEHFCQSEQALAGLQDEVYKEMFQIFHWLLNPNSKRKRVATTTIHFADKQLNPRMFLRNPFLQLLRKEGFHFSILHRGYGGYYPEQGQLERCAKGLFKLVKEIDGTEDYRLTSEYWCKALKNALWYNKEFRRRLFYSFLKKPAHTFWVVLSMIGPEAWPWQFRGKNPPTRLYRQTWQMI
ncbi:MAG: class I SAM-dependent methyltransferase [Patescibacteria group bacterium]